MTKAKNGKLLYRASRDGFTGKVFHSKCDNKANTITIIKNNLNYVFGGYTSSAWNSHSVTVSDANAYIFSLRRNGISKCEKFAIKQAQDAVYSCSNYGPVFGGGYADIFIINKSNVNFGSCTNFGDSYQLPDGYTKGCENTKSYLAGNYNQWVTVEIEVYQIMN